jgi:hypothetical protein
MISLSFLWYYPIPLFHCFFCFFLFFC